MSMQPYEPAGAVELRHDAAPDLMNWAREAAEVHKIAQALSTTSFVPPALHGRPDEIAAQILYGRDVNLPPMIALAQINIIDRRPSLSALAMRGLAQNKGVKFRLDDSSEVRCKMSALAPGDANWTTVTWTIDRAKKLGLTGKQNWTKQPQAMLIARATSELCRLVAAPLFLGMSYSTEELKDGTDDLSMLADEPVLAEQSAAAPPDKPRTVQRQTPLKATATVHRVREEPAEQPVAEEKAYEPPAQDVVSEQTRKALMATFTVAGMRERGTRLAYVSDLLKREVHSVNQITEAEGRAILDQLHIDFSANTNHGDGWADAKVAEVPA